MNVLIATPLYPPDDGGPATFAKILKDELPNMGIGVSVVSFGSVRHLPKFLSHAVYFGKIARAALHADTIIALDPVSVGVPALLAAILCRKRFILRVAGDYAWEQGAQRFGVKENLDEFILLTEENVKHIYPKLMRLWRIERRVARYADIVVVPSAYLEGIVRMWGVGSEHIRLVYNAFTSSLPKGSKDMLQKELGVVPPTVISVGRFVPWKGFKVLMDVVADVRNKTGLHVTLELAGSGETSEYERHAEKHGYTFVKFLGVLQHDDLMKRIKAADCFALNTGYEGLSHVILEAMALETPVVTTDVGGNKELFAAHTQNWLAHYNEKEQLAALITQVLRDPLGAKRDAQRAKDYISSFTTGRMINGVRQLLVAE